MPLPRRLFAELVEWLYREDRFLRQTLIIGEKAATPQHIHAPLLSVIDSQCVIAPPAAVLPFYENVPSVSKSLLWYPGEIGVALQHVGMLVGQQAHRQLWPAIIRWLHDTAG
jgi:polyhydroxyalkanoate synthase